MKTCNKCYIKKSNTSFYKDKASTDGLAYQCKECSNSTVKVFRSKHPEYRRAEALKRLYGITVDDYENILKAQGGGCAICGKKQGVEKKRLAVDHSHKDRRVRGLLCHRCNKWLVGKHVDGSLLIKAGQYLETADTGFVVPEKYQHGPKKRRQRRKRNRKP